MIYKIDLVFMEIPAKSCIVGILLTYPIQSIYIVGEWSLAAYTSKFLSDSLLFIWPISSGQHASCSSRLALAANR